MPRKNKKKIDLLKVEEPESMPRLIYHLSIITSLIYTILTIYFGVYAFSLFGLLVLFITIKYERPRKIRPIIEITIITIIVMLYTGYYTLVEIFSKFPLLTSIFISFFPFYVAYSIFLIANIFVTMALNFSAETIPSIFKKYPIPSLDAVMSTITSTLSISFIISLHPITKSVLGNTWKTKLIFIVGIIFSSFILGLYVWALGSKKREVKVTALTLQIICLSFFFVVLFYELIWNAVKGLIATKLFS